MIRISDNYAALMLADKVGLSNAQKSLETDQIPGFDITSDKSPQVNAKALSLFFEKIYKKKAISVSASQDMLDILASQQINDRIPALLPDGTKVAHKTGDLDGLRHDAGVVFGQKSDYIFVFLTDTDDPETTAQNTAQVSKDIYNTLEN